jgi:hypothetical protein
MLGDCFIDSLLHGSAAKKIAPRDRIKAADAAVKRAKDHKIEGIEMKNISIRQLLTPFTLKRF